MKLTKTEVNKLLVEERKKSRLKQKNSEFMKRSLSIYKGQEQRKCSPGGVGAAVHIPGLPFTIDQFREWLLPYVDQLCDCGKKLTIKGLAVDHCIPIARGGSWGLENLDVLCKSCNFRKGQLLPSEFTKLCNFVNQELTPESREDLWRRLTLGGKWSFGR